MYKQETLSNLNNYNLQVSDNLILFLLWNCVTCNQYWMLEALHKM